jgi:hypothetical protein
VVRTKAKAYGCFSLKGETMEMAEIQCFSGGKTKEISKKREETAVTATVQTRSPI